MNPAHNNPAPNAHRPRILLCNDDGYQAPGIRAIFTALQSLAEVEIVAPAVNNSAKSNAITIHDPLYVYDAEPGIRYVTGTPADCMHLALTGLLDYRPDLIISGINNGANMGDDTIYSGTVGAAMEGYLFGIPALAFSQVETGWKHLDAAAHSACALVQHILDKQMLTPPQAWLLNVNIPNLPLAEIKAPRVCRLGKRHAAEAVTQQQNPRGQTMYWVGAAGPAADAGEGTDFHTTQLGHVAVTPLQIDLTAHAHLHYWGQSLRTEGHWLQPQPTPKTAECKAKNQP